MTTMKMTTKIYCYCISSGQFSFNNQPKSLGAATIVEFIEKAIENCADGDDDDYYLEFIEFN